MAELYRHTDEYGARLAVRDSDVGTLVVIFARGWLAGAVEVPKVDGRRLLDALVNHYGSKDSIEEEARRG